MSWIRLDWNGMEWNEFNGMDKEENEEWSGWMDEEWGGVRRICFVRQDDKDCRL